ncbi:MAG: Clp protease N-terminal domain-containing protein, partial [Armatimonadota bacterium]
MWGLDVGERFTERARAAILRAREEAGRLGHARVGTEHLLLGVLGDGDSVAVHVLTRLGVSMERTISEIESHIAVFNGARLSDVGLTLEAKHAIDLAHEEADRLGSDFVGTEHLLLGLMKEGHGTAAYVLKKLGAQVHSAEQLVAH